MEDKSKTGLHTEIEIFKTRIKASLSSKMTQNMRIKCLGRYIGAISSVPDPLVRPKNSRVQKFRGSRSETMALLSEQKQAAVTKRRERSSCLQNFMTYLLD